MKKVFNDDLLYQKIGLIVGIIFGFIVGLFISDQAEDSLEFIEEEQDETPE
jgi:uncharacterized membrane-anchored protein YhcB (DUF1043 family)